MGAPQKKTASYSNFGFLNMKKQIEKTKEMKLFNNAIFKNFQNKKYFVIRKFT